METRNLYRWVLDDCLAKVRAELLNDGLDETVVQQIQMVGRRARRAGRGRPCDVRR